MASWSIISLVLLILQSANAITFPTLVPTGKHNIASEPPEPTPRLRLHHRDSFASLKTSSSVQTETPAVCGWLDTTDIDPVDPYVYSCVSGNSCVYHMPNSAFGGLVGCCSDDDCGFTTACYDSAKVASDPSKLSGNTAFTIFCTQSTAAQCATYIWRDVGYSITDFQCASVSTVYSVYVEGTLGGTVDGTMTLVSLYTTTADDNLISAYTSLYDVSTSISKPRLQASPTRSMTAIETAAESTTVDSEDSDSPKSTGAGKIAGGVVGGVAGVCAIGGSALFFLLRRKKKKKNQQGQQNGLNVSEQDRGQSTWESQRLSELEGHALPNLAKSHGGSPANAPHEIDSRALSAELPAPDESTHHRN